MLVLLLLLLLQVSDAMLSATLLARLLLAAAGASRLSRCSKERTAGSVGTAVPPHEKLCPLLAVDDASFDCCRPKTGATFSHF